MNIFVPKINSKYKAEFQPPTVKPLDENGHVRRADIDSGLAKIVIDPQFLEGDHVNYRQVSSAGTWFGQLIVKDPTSPLKWRCTN